MLKVFRDTFIVWVLTFLSGVIIGAAAGPTDLDRVRMLMAVALGNIVFTIVGFTIIGAMAKVRRFRHLAKVALLLWPLGLLNLLVGGAMFSLFVWLLSLPLLFLLMAIGGALSFLFAPAPEPRGEPAVSGTFSSPNGS